MSNFEATIASVHPRSLRHFSDALGRLVERRIWAQIILAMVLGVGTGIALSPDIGWVEPDTADAIGRWLAFPGSLFLTFLQMIVVPLILASIIRGIAAANDLQQLKNVGVWIAVYFLATTVLAVAIGISLGLIIRPGAYIDAASFQQETLQTEEISTIEEAAAEMADQQESVAIADIPDQIVGVIPTNPMGSIVEGEMLQIVIFAIVLGIGLLSLPAVSAKPLLDLLGSIQGVCMAIVGAVMTIAPLAVFGLLAQAMINTGPQVLAGLGVYSASVVFGMAVLLLIYLAIAMVLGRTGIKRFFEGIREPFLLGFSTDSSAATMPITIKSADTIFRVRPSLSQFIIPLGATVNMGGTALYQGLAAMFMAQMFQIDLPLSALIALVATALGASIGTPAIPGVGIIMLATVLSGAGIPLGGLALIIGVDRILERFRTSLNVTGDLVACKVMDALLPSSITKLSELRDQRLVERRRSDTDGDVVVAHLSAAQLEPKTP